MVQYRHALQPDLQALLYRVVAKNDRLVYLTAAEVAEYLDEIERGALPTSLIGFTGGEPFMNPELPAMLDDALSRGFQALVLTNAMKPMTKCGRALLRLNKCHRDRLTIRVSIDHYGRQVHEQERGRRSWQPTIDGLLWLARNGFTLNVASRRLSGESEAGSAPASLAYLPSSAWRLTPATRWR